jgi:multiple sugar transport system permease protein
MAAPGRVTRSTGDAAGTTGSPGAPAGPATRRNKRVSRHTGAGLLFVAPFTLLLIAFLVLPLAYAFRISLYRSTLVGGDVFTWFDNYKQAYHDPQFRAGVLRVLLFGVVQTPVMIGLALLAALLVDSVTGRLARVFRLAAFVPYAVPAVIGTLMWGFLYSPSTGPLASAAAHLGLGHVDFLSQNVVLASLGNVVTWMWAGYNMIVLYAALQGVPRELYEAAAIDGASRLQISLRIKVPLISSALVLVTVFTIVGTLQFFTEPLLLQPLNPGSITNSYTPNIYAYNQAFSYQQYNYSAAISFLLGAVVFVGAYLFLFLTRRRSSLR